MGGKLGHRFGPARLAAAVALALLLPGCAGAQSEVKAPASRSDADGEAAQKVLAFRAVEDEVLADLGALDRRFAMRAQSEPREEDIRRVTMGAMLAEDSTLAVIDGAIDPFSFEARARGLAAAKAKLAKASAALPSAAPGSVLAPALERELLGRVVDEETIRLEEERALPRSASSLVRAVVETWSRPQTPVLAAERDRWLARRLKEIRVSITGEGGGKLPGSLPLDVVRARELDDALDALEHLMDAAALGGATEELVRLRETLEALATRPAASASSTWPDVELRLRAHLGIALGPDAIDQRLDRLERALRAEAEQAIASEKLQGDYLAANAATLVLVNAPCAVAVPGSRVRSMGATAERGPSCHLRREMLGGGDAKAHARALVALHDHVVVAQWALDVAHGTATILQTEGKHRPLSRPGPDVIARWERIALARPVAAIGGGLAAELLVETGDPEARAKAWAELGEVPLDIAERELAPAR